MPSISPRTQQLQMGAGAGAGVDQATAMFERGFSDMAYNILTNKLPDLVQDVVTFKVLDTDIDHGTAVGAFVIMRGERPLYLPVVMSENNIKPLELVYDKSLNVFLPLSKGWLDELDKTSLSSLGKGVKTPDTLYTDVDLRNVVVPPLTGRFSYASLHDPCYATYVENPNSFAPTDVVILLEKTASEPATILLRFLAAAPNQVKLAFSRVLEKNPKLLKRAAAAYGVTALTNALRPRLEKVAAKQLYGGGLWIADKDTTPTEFRRIFGDRAAEAYAGVRRKGYASKDNRLNRNLAVQEQPYERWIEPRQPGVYVLYKSDGTEAPALVISNPINILAEGDRYGRRPSVPGHNPLVNNSYYDPDRFGGSIKYYPDGRPNEGDYVVKRTNQEFLAVLSNGDYLETNKLAGRDSVADTLSGGPLHKRLFQDLTGEPKQGLGFWVRQKGTTIQATVPVEVKSVTTGSDGIRRVEVTGRGGYPEKTIVTEPKHPYGTIWMPKGANMVYLPPDFVWIPLKTKLRPRDFFTSAIDLASCVSSALAASGAKKVAIKNAGSGQFSLEGGPAMSKVAALRTIATNLALSVPDVEALLEKAAEERRVQFWLVSPEGLAKAQLKFGADDGEKKPKKKSPPPGNGGGEDPSMQDPAMAGGDPSADPQAAAMMAAAAQQPPEPSPTDLAAMEMDQHIQQEIQKLQEKQEMLIALTQRANEIAGGAPPMPTVQTQAMGAPPATQNLATGAPTPPSGMPPGPSMGGAQPGMDPMMGGAQPGMDPMMGGAPSPQAGTDPMMMGAAPGGALPQAMPGDPSMMGGDPSMMGGGMPQQQQQPSMAMMGPDGINAQGLDQQINPQFLGSAADLQSNDIFDAAAVATLAQSPAVREIVSQYLPNLEKALDNLGRVLLSLEMQEPMLKEEIGELAFTNLEDNLRTTFRGMGDLVLRLSQSAHTIKGQNENASA